MKKLIKIISLFSFVFLLFISVSATQSGLVSVSVPAAAHHWSDPVGPTKKTDQYRSGFKINTKGTLTPIYGQLYRSSTTTVKSLHKDVKMDYSWTWGDMVLSQYTKDHPYYARIISSTYEPNRGTVTFYYWP